MSNKANTTTVTLSDGREVCLSYGKPVAAFIPRTTANRDEPCGYVRTARKFSATSSKHATMFAGRDAKVVPDDVFCALVAPLETGR